MAHRFIHYEAAFEDYVRSRGWAYLPIDEQKRAIFSGARVKSFDFLVYPPGQRAWLVDVKGRKFPYEVNGGRRYWENWVTRDDLDGLDRWRDVFGADFDPVFVFAYWLTGDDRPEPSDTVHTFRGQSYAFLWVLACDYAEKARPRSEKWETVSVPVKAFREMARPVGAERSANSSGPSESREERIPDSPQAYAGVGTRRG